MTKYILCFLLVGCGTVQRSCTAWTGELSKKCYEGVEYLQSDSGLALSVDKDGKPKVCK